MLRGSSLIAMPPVVEAYTPTAGQTVVLADNANSRIVQLVPAALLATLTVTLPTDANSVIGQVVRISSSKAVTLLTVNGATIIGAPSGLILGDNIGFQKTGVNTWARMN
jgi:hypothetical protein